MDETVTKLTVSILNVSSTFIATSRVLRVIYVSSYLSYRTETFSHQHPLLLSTLFYYHYSCCEIKKHNKINIFLLKYFFFVVGRASTSSPSSPVLYFFYFVYFFYFFVFFILYFFLFFVFFIFFFFFSSYQCQMRPNVPFGFVDFFAARKDS